MTGVFRVLLSMDVRADQTNEFERAWTAIAESIAEQPANLSQSLMRSNEEASRYHILSDWTDEESFRVFELSEAHVAYRARLAPYRSGVTITTMHVVGEISVAYTGNRGGNV
jgi:heme-degrading monooxygenase HmoA